MILGLAVVLPAGARAAAPGTVPHAFFKRATPTLKLLAGGLGGAGGIDGVGPGARFYTPAGSAVDAAGNVYVADSVLYVIRRVTPAGVTSVFAGTKGASGSVDGTGAAARFVSPSGLGFDASGNLYVTDSHALRKITPAGVVTTLAGVAGTSGTADGTGTAARFNSPTGVAASSAGDLYVTDSSNYAIRKVTAAGVVTTFAGLPGTSGSADGTGTAARFGSLGGPAFDSAGNLYVAAISTCTVRKITPAAVVTTFIGTANSCGTADGTGAAAQLSFPSGVAIDGSDRIYVADSNSHVVRTSTLAGVVTTLAGSPNSGGAVDGTGATARFLSPNAPSVNAAGDVFLTETNNNDVRQITAAGVVTTLAGAAAQSGAVDATGAAARFNAPGGVAVDAAGTVYVANTFGRTIRVITRDGVVTTLAGLAGSTGSADGTGSAARFNRPGGVAVDAAFNVYVADTYNHTIRKITPGGVVTTLAGTAGSAGSTDGTGAAARFFRPISLTVDAGGTIFVADMMNHTIRQVTAAGVVTTFAGTAGSAAATNGTGAAARFNQPTGITIDPAGNLYVSDSYSHLIRRVTPGGVVTTVAGTANVPGNVDANGTSARFNYPNGVAVDTAGTLYVAENNTFVRRIALNADVTTVVGELNKMGVALGPLKATVGNVPAVAVSPFSLYLISENSILYAEKP